MTIRQQILQDHIEKTAIKLGISQDYAFLIFGHSLFTDKSIHSFDPNDNVDGGMDKQIDAITIQDEGDEAIIYITQIKNEDTFSSNRIIHIGNGLKWIFSKPKADVDTLINIKFKDRINDYRTIWGSYGTSNIHIKVAYITKALTSAISDECKQEIKSIKDTYSDGTFASFSFETIGADELLDIISSQEKKNKKIDADIKIVYDTNKPSLIEYTSKGLKGVICSASASEIASVVLNDKNGYVFDLNIRRYLGKLGGVNKDILSTCTEKDISNLFWFLNNGVTIVCDKIDPVKDPDNPLIKIKNLQIVNGCQTATSLALAFGDGTLQPDTKLLLRIYETNNLDLVDKIVLTTNNQNKISGRNLRANDKFQIDLEAGFKLYNYSFERKPRQFDSSAIPKDLIVPNEDVAVSYLGIVLCKSSDARSRKYKVWNEYYTKIFTGGITEPYLLSALIHRKVNRYLLSNFASETDNTKRYLSKNASFHISRITSFLWRKVDKWADIADLKKSIMEITKKPESLNLLIDNAMNILNGIIVANPKYINDLNSALKSADLDAEINRILYTSHKPKKTKAKTAPKKKAKAKK